MIYNLDGIKFMRKPLSDEQYVEQIRKKDLSLRRMRWLWPVGLLVMLYCLVRFSDIVEDLTSDLHLERKLVYMGLLLGVSFGALFFSMALQTANLIKHWIDARHGFRMERLLLKYHDELMNKKAHQASQTITEPGPGVASSAPQACRSTALT